MNHPNKTTRTPRRVDLKFGPSVLIQFSVQNLLGHLNLTLEAVLSLVALIGLEWVLIGRLSVRASGSGLPLPSEHNSVPKLQPLQQAAVGKLQQNGEAQRVFKDNRGSFVHISKGWAGGILFHYIVTQQLRVVAWRKPVHPEPGCFSLPVLRILILVVFCAFRLSERISHSSVGHNQELHTTEPHGSGVSLRRRTWTLSTC